jgi:hypothetical protein
LKNSRRDEPVGLPVGRELVTVAAFGEGQGKLFAGLQCDCDGGETQARRDVPGNLLARNSDFTSAVHHNLFASVGFNSVNSGPPCSRTA